MLLSALLAVSVAPCAPDVPHGSYVEARTATVFAGACHYGSEYATGGREAVLAWRFDGGRFQGVDLTGVELAAVVGARENLRDARQTQAGPRSVVYLSAASTPAQRRAAFAWLEAHVPALGDVTGISVCELDVDVVTDDGGVDRYDVTVGAEDARRVALAGSTLADRACCTMPYRVWYEPLAQVRERRVGHSTSFVVREDRLAFRSQREDENNAFVARF